ncbi:MAG: hypothetical protein J0M12_02465 [Deltaproteobacteria bacterium]|nr:hypothetical protein [Deltaproteobacteria bacterium]
MKGVVRCISNLTCAVIFSAVVSYAGSATAQTHCNICGPYSSQCQGTETYINLDGTGSTGAGVLSYLWGTDCADVDLLNPTSATPVLVLYGPGKGNAANCKVYLEINDSGACGCSGNCSCIDQCETTVNVGACQVDCEGTINGTKVLDRCGVCGGDGMSCLGCTNVDITQDQFVLDGNTLELKKLVNHKNNDVKKLARTSQDKAFVKASNKEADKLYKQSWALAWSIPSIYTSCTNQVFCTSTSNEATITTFDNSSTELNKLLKATVKKLRKLRGYKVKADQKALTQGDTINQQNLTISASIPANVSACTAP